MTPKNALQRRRVERMGMGMSVGGKERNAWTAAGGGRGGDDCGCWENCDLNFRLISLGDAAQRAVPVLPIRVKFAAHNFGFMYIL